MSVIDRELSEKIKCLSPDEKLALVDLILTELDKPDPEIDRIWAEEARKRWEAYKSGKVESVPYEDVMKKYR
jgi:putative addiction module component (TIGR02574 family)